MSDLEWYLDVGGKQSGPHSAKEIVEMVRGGRIPATSQVTAARMNGDWVVAQDLIDAYDELYTKPAMAVPIAVSGGTVFTTGPSDPNFTAPPRPTEQLERSKIITLNREELANMPDPTEALFQAIQAVREKANQKVGTNAAVPPTAARENPGQLGHPGSSRTQPLILVLTLAAIFGLTIYGVVKMIGGKKAEEAVKTPIATKIVAEPPPPRRPGSPSGGLLNTQGRGESAARTTPPVQAPRRIPARPMGGTSERDEPVNKGGARYRDERDAPVSDDAEVDETDVDPNRGLQEPVPVDPSQVPVDRIIPDPGMYPGRGLLPGADPYQPPPPPPGDAQ